MQEQFNCDAQFTLSDNNELTIEMFPDEDLAGIIEKSTIVLENLTDYGAIEKRVIQEFNSMLKPAGKYMEAADDNLLRELHNILKIKQQEK